MVISDSGENIVQIQVRVPESVRNEFKATVALNGETSQSVMEDALIEYMEKRGKDVSEIKAAIYKYREESKINSTPTGRRQGSVTEIVRPDDKNQKMA